MLDGTLLEQVLLKHKFLVKTPTIEGLDTGKVTVTQLSELRKPYYMAKLGELRYGYNKIKYFDIELPKWHRKLR